MTQSGHLPLVTVTRLPETLLEVVRQEGVQHGVDGRVAVLEAVGEEDDDDESSIIYIERVSPTCLVVEQLYLEDLEVKVIPVDRSPPSLSSS